MEGRAHLRRKGEVCSPVFFQDGHSQLIDEFSLSQILEKRANESKGKDLGLIAAEKLRDPRNAVADDILQKLARQSSNPMPLIPQNGSRVSGAAQFVPIVALHVHRSLPQEAASYQRPHAPCRMAELVVVAGGDLEPFLVGKSKKAFCLVPVQGEGLLHVHMTLFFQATGSHVEVAFGGGRDMNHVGTALAQHLCKVGETPFNRKPLRELACHQGFAVADCHDLAFRYPSYLGGMGIRDFAASDHGDLKHCLSPPDRPRNSAETLPPWVSWAPTPIGFSALRYCTALFSKTPATASR